MPEITPQSSTESGGGIRNGEKIVDDLDRGDTGWLNWTGGHEALTGIKTDSFRTYYLQSSSTSVS